MEGWNKLSKEYDELFFLNQVEFIENIRNTNYIKNDYCVFYPSFGVKENERSDLLFYGQAVNGWNNYIDDNPTRTHVENAKRVSNNALNNTKLNPLDWVNIMWNGEEYDSYMNRYPELKSLFSKKKYKTYRSFFWNVVFKLTSDYHCIDRGSGNWSEKTIWSNLYKIAPESKNPNSDEKNAQIDYSIKLFKQELLEIQPKYCILLTNEEWWRPFKKSIDLTDLVKPSHLNEIVDFQQFQTTKIIVTTRPYLPFDGENHVKQIMELIKMQ